MANQNSTLTPETVRRVLDYSSDTGEFFWKKRQASMFQDTEKRKAAHSCAVWNANYAGSRAGSPNNKGYLQIAIFGKLYKAHRLAWMHVYGEVPQSEIDHIDGDKLNNRIDNLRQCTRTQNMRNTGIYKSNSSGVKNVHLRKSTGKWRAALRVDGKVVRIGQFDTLEAAEEAVRSAREEMHGQFARHA